MQKLKGIKLYSFTDADIYNGEIISNTEKELKLREVRLEENIMIKAFKKYKKEELGNNQVDTDLIKVMLNKNKDIAIEQCKQLKLKNKQYIAWFATPSMMKKEDKDTNSQCEMFFINKRYRDFMAQFEEAISLGKIKDFYGQDRVINKDLSRIALATSNAFEINLIPKIVILPECKGRVVSDIVTIIDDKVVEIIEDSPQELLQYRNRENTMFDGCGVMSMEFAKEIQEELKVDYPISLAGIRMYNGLAVKGLVTSMDFNSYFKEFYTGDTGYFKKVDDIYYAKDMYGDFQDVTNADMILNESQCKWAGNFNSMDEVYDLLNSPEFTEYKNLLSHLYITKINKKDDDIKEYSRSNYQLLGNIAITEKELDKLSAETERIYKEILNGNEDITRIFWGDIINEIKVNEEGNEIEDLAMSTKAQELLAINSDFIKLGYVKRAVAKVITKKINELAAGKFYIKGNYKTLTQDPISYLDWIMNREDDKLTSLKNGLQANRFYCSSINKGEIRTASRNPLNSFSEILNIEFDRNKVIDKYIGHLSKEVCVFNAYDLTANVMSGADFDLDMAFIVNDEIIKNSVVEDLPFINLEDGKDKEMEFTPENRLEATLEASGDLIGSLAMSGAGASSLATVAGYKMYKSKKGKMYNYDKLVEGYFNSNLKNKSFDDFQNKLSERFDFIENCYTEEELKEQIKKGLFDGRKDSYELRNLQMLAIDAPKSLVTPEVPKDLKFKRPRYLKYVKSHLNNKNTKNHSNALNLHASRIARELLKEDIELKKAADNLRLVQGYLVSPNYALENKDAYESCKERIGKLYQEYLDKKSANKDFNEDIAKLAEQLEKKEISKDDFEDKKAEINKKRYKLMLEIEAKIMVTADKVIAEYDNKLISHALATLSCSEAFMFNFFFIAVIEILKEKCKGLNTISYFDDNENGNIDYLFKKYRKITVDRSDDENLLKLHNENREKIKAKLAKCEDKFTHKVRIMITNSFIEMDKVDKVVIGTQLFKNKIQAVLNTKEGKCIGFIFGEFNAIDEYRNITDYEGQTVNVSDIEVNHKSATLALSV